MKFYDGKGIELDPNDGLKGRIKELYAKIKANVCPSGSKIKGKINGKTKRCHTDEAKKKFRLSGPSSGLRFISAIGRDKELCSGCKAKNDCKYGEICKRNKKGSGHKFSGEFGDYDCEYCNLYFNYDV